MRWFSFFILAYLVLGLQAGIGTAMQYDGARPNLVLLAVVFIAMNAPRDAALLAAFMLGALQDLSGQGTIGLYCFSYGLVAMFVVAVHQAVYREHPLTHVALALAGGLITALVAPPGRALQLFGSAVYSAILAPLVLGGLQRIKSVFQFLPTRNRRGPVSFR
jgi:rod shape-determining protein MreD